MPTRTKSGKVLFQLKEIKVFSGIVAMITLVASIYVAYLEMHKPVAELQAELSKIVAGLRVKIVNIGVGCKHPGSIHGHIVEQENIARVELTDELIGIGESANLKEILGKNAFAELKCFIQYNGMLDQRENICKGPFKTEKEMIDWQLQIYDALHHKSNNILKECPYIQNKRASQMMEGRLKT